MMEHIPTPQDEFTAAVKEWQQLRNTRDPSADSYYEKFVFPEIFHRFVPSIQQEHRAYRGLILLGSGQPDTAALLIAGLNPERVAFLLTSTTQQFRTQVQHRLDALGLVQMLRCPPDQWLPLGEPPTHVRQEDSYRDLHSDHSTVLNTYRGVRLVLKTWSDLPHAAVAVDLTAGKSTMTVGLAKSAHILSLPSIYIDSDYEHNAIKQGTQRLASTANPYVVFGHLEADEAHRLFAAHDYSGAQRIFAALGERVPGTDGALFQSYAALASAYALWDAFDLPEAERELATLLAVGLPLELTIHGRALEAQAAGLHRLNAVTRDLTDRYGPSLRVLGNPEIVCALLGSLHANALRREVTGRLDAAALLHYRCLELMAQHRLALLGVVTDRPDFTTVRRRMPDIEQRYVAVLKAHGRRRFLELPDRAIGLFVGYMLLEALHDPLVVGYDIGQIERRTEARNKSILAHGYRLITEAEYRPFREVVEVMVDRFLGVVGQNRKTWEAASCFIRLSIEEAT